MGAEMPELGKQLGGCRQLSSSQHERCQPEV